MPAFTAPVVWLCSASDTLSLAMRMYNRNLVFAAACLGMLLFGIVFLSLGSVNNMLAERFHLDNNGIGTLTALLPLASWPGR